MINRLDLIQKIIDAKRAKTYLEIGIFNGDCFIPVKSETKIGIDIAPPVKRVEDILNDQTKYFQMTSDKFFETQSGIFTENKIDVAFIDGFHSYGQSLKDVENCLKYLSEDGVIIMHDCNPPIEKAGIPFKSYEEKDKARFVGDWMGDVWKTIVYLRSVRGNLNVMVLGVETGLGIITRAKGENMLDFTPEDIERMTYADLKAKRELLLNMKGPEYAEGLLKGLDL